MIVNKALIQQQLLLFTATVVTALAHDGIGGSNSWIRVGVVRRKGMITTGGVITPGA